MQHLILNAKLFVVIEKKVRSVIKEKGYEKLEKAQLSANCSRTESVVVSATWEDGGENIDRQRKGEPSNPKEHPVNTVPLWCHSVRK